MDKPTSKSFILLVAIGCGAIGVAVTWYLAAMLRALTAEWCLQEIETRLLMARYAASQEVADK